MNGEDGRGGTCLNKLTNAGPSSFLGPLLQPSRTPRALETLQLEGQESFKAKRAKGGVHEGRERGEREANRRRGEERRGDGRLPPKCSGKRSPPVRRTNRGTNILTRHEGLVALKQSVRTPCPKQRGHGGKLAELAEQAEQPAERRIRTTEC